MVNDGDGNFLDETEKWSPAFKSLGLVTDAQWVDLNDDKGPELIVVGEWMPISVWQKSENSFTNVTKDYFDAEYEG